MNVRATEKQKTKKDQSSINGIRHYIGKVDRLKIKKLLYLIRTGNFQKIKTYLRSPSVRESITTDALDNGLIDIPNDAEFIMKPNKKYKITDTINIGLIGTLSDFNEISMIKNMLDIIHTKKLNVQFILIGSSENNLNDSAFYETGRYHQESIALLTLKNDIDLFFLSSVSPETNSLVAEITMKMEMPVASFDVGPQAELIKNYERGFLISDIDADIALGEMLNFINEHVQWSRNNKKVLFVAEYISFASRYRVEHFREQLLIQGVDTDFIMSEELPEDQILPYDVVVFYRLRNNPRVVRFAKQCHSVGIKVCYDIDDFIFEYRKIKHLQFLKGIDYVDFSNDSKQIKQCMKLCDGFITSTENMKMAMKDSFPDIPVIVNRNVASMEMVTLSLMAEKGKLKEKDKITLGYFSGSKTHDKDFEKISNVILQLFKKYDNLFLKTVGVLQVGEEFKEYENRMIHVEFVDWRELPKLIASVDINLMPLEDTFFHACKSENKWMEAALVNVPTVASWNEELERMIQNDITGYLCKTETEWFAILSKLVESSDLREKVSLKAQKFVLENCTTTKTSEASMGFIIN